MNTIVIQSSEVISSPAAELFKHVLERDLLTAFDNIPFVADFAPIGSLDTERNPGSQRIIFFEDSNSARQIFLTFITDWSFSVRIDNFSSIWLTPLRWVEYQFVFFDSAEESCTVSATYQFKMRSKVEMFLFRVLARNFMQKRFDLFLKRMSQSIGQYRIERDWSY
ncbi:hypothetical protein [Flavobacterium sp. FlaQc-48]|uniref:hypothetical protein n=1 Tax=Flavobacterium sp. FlaQc-48 TaxID=3374181 RepID=UPI00375691C0